MEEEEEAWRSNHWGGSIEETSGEHLELSGKHPGWIWESFGSHLRISWNWFGRCLGIIWEEFGGLDTEEASGRNVTVRSQKLQYLSAKTKKLHPINHFTL